MVITIVTVAMVAVPIFALTPDTVVPLVSKAEHSFPWLGDEEILDIPWDVDPHVNRILRILHVTDTHFSSKSDSSPWSDRMHNLGASGKNGLSGEPTTPAAEFTNTLNRAKKEDVDLVAIGGDLLNFPSRESVDWTVQQLKAMKAPFVFTAGNHDWHLERKFEWEESYDSQRMPSEYGVLRDLYLNSGKGVPNRSFTDPRFGYAALKSGLLVVTIDNSNYQVDSQQLEFFSKMACRGQPLLLLLHIPLHLPGLPSWGADLVMGHPAWGRESDRSWTEEGRLQWPPNDSSAQNSTTLEFIEAVKRAAQAKVLVAVLTGHTHKNAVVSIPCPHDAKTGCHTTAKQYTTRSNSQGWSRLFQLRFVPTASTHANQKLRAAKPQEAPTMLPSKQHTPQHSSSPFSYWAMQAAMIFFFGVAVLTALTGFSQQFLLELLSGKRGSWAYCESHEKSNCNEKFHSGTVASKLGLVSEMPGLSEVSKYGTLDAQYEEVLL